MKVLVTGGAGFIGSHIVDLLVESKHEVIVIDNLSTGSKEFLNKYARFYLEDITSVQLDYIFNEEKPEYVIHHSAQVDVSKSIRDPVSDATSNIIGTVRLLEYCRRFQVRKIIYASSCAVYGETSDCSIPEGFPAGPVSCYGVSKYTPELYIRVYQQLYGLSYTILRYGNVYGPRQTLKGEGGVVAIFMNKLLKGELPFIYGDGEQTRDFVYVKDVAAANVLALEKGPNQILNISVNQKTSINRLYTMISSLFSHPIPPDYLSIRSGDIPHSRLDNLKAMQMLGWQPKYDLAEGLKETKVFYVVSEG